MSSNTNKLKLLKVDPIADGEQYFNIDTMLNENWDKVDTYAQEMASKVDDNLLPRLDTVKTKELTLQPGLQIVNAEKTSPFQLTGLKGRTLLNLTGSDWTPTKNITRFINYQSTLSIDNNKSATSGNALKITAAVANSIADGFGKNTVNLISGKKYIALGHLYNETGQSMKLVIQNTAIESPTTTSKNKWEFIYVPFVAGGNVSNAYPIARLTASAVGNAGYADAIRLYEISDTEYTAITAMTSEQIAAAYPYVDSLSPVRNPYMIAYGENLLPTLQEWTSTEGTPIINNRYSVDVSSTNKIIHSSIAVIPGVTYKLSAVSSGSTGRIFVYNTNGAVALADSTGSGSLSAVFTVPAGVNIIEVRLLGTSTTAVNLSNMMLNVGTAPKTFKPREDSMLALQTDLYANPVTGTNADEVFERDGQYFRLTKWKRVLLDDNLPWELFTSLNGIKIVKVDASTFNATFDDTSSYFAVKHDGSILDYKISSDRKDQIQLNNSTEGKRLFVSISAIDSGWGDSYTPTSNEIKAYFLGWKMYDSSDSSGNTLYNRTDGTNKAWTPLASYNNTNYSGATATVPLVKPETSGIVYRQSREIKSYQLVYKLNKPYIEPIFTEGQIFLKEGTNQIEVGTGIVLRESTKPLKDPFNGGTNWNINNGSSSYEASLTKNKISKIIGIYKNSQLDNWVIYPKTVTSAGVLAQQPDANFDITASYSISYITLNQTPMVNVSGEYGLNEKTILQELISGFQQSNTRLSVVENKKADKDSSSWIQPTFQSNWSPFTTGYTNGYKKIAGTNMVVFHFCLYGGLTSISTILFRFPENYRPKQNVIFTGFSRSGDSSVLATTAFEIRSTGYALIGTGVPQNGAYMVSGIFEAEQ